MHQIYKILLFIFFWIVMVLNIVNTYAYNSKNISNNTITMMYYNKSQYISYSDNSLILKLPSKQEIISPINWTIQKIGKKIFVYNKNKNIVLEIDWIEKYNNIIKIKKWEIIWITKKNWKFKVKLLSEDQGMKVNIYFFKKLFKNFSEKNLKKDKNIHFNNYSYLKKLSKYESFNKEYYKKFFKWLNINAKNSVLSESELLSYKLTTKDKFIDIINFFKNNHLILNKEQELKYFRYRNFTKCLYSETIEYCKVKYPNELKDLNNLISEIYNVIILPNDKDYLQQIINKNKTLNLNKNIYNIPDWKVKIYSTKNIDKNMFLTLAAINKQECWREDWACLSGWDAWPFQINYIHTKDYVKSKKMVYEIRKTIDQNKKQKLIEELFNYQLDWTINRFNRLSSRFCKNDKDNNLTKCLAILHNWNNRRSCYSYWKWIPFKYCYSNSVVNIKRKYLDIYKI